jgi:hypothetical protein
MKTRWCCCGVVVTALLAGPVVAQERTPLRMDLAPIARAQNAAASQPLRAQGYRASRSFSTPQERPVNSAREARLTRAEAVGTLGFGLLTAPDAADATATTQPASGYPVLQFQKRGPIVRDLRRGYRAMGENLAHKVWDEPKGKRIVFDVAGKPGVGIEIPLH